MTHQIEIDLYGRQGKGISNFKTHLPTPQSDLARQTLKDMQKPIGVSEYELTRQLPEKLKFALPSIEAIEAEIEGLNHE